MKYHIAFAAIMAASVCSIGAQMAYGQSLPDSTLSECTTLEAKLGLVLFSEVMEIQKIYPDSNIDQISEWLGEHIVSGELDALPEELQARILNKRPAFIEAVKAWIDAGCVE